MSVYMTEEEQLAIIKKWWQRYSTILLVIFSLVLLSASAYRYWQNRQIKLNTEASNAYEHLMVAFSNQDDKGIRSYAKKLINDFGKTVYAEAASLSLAKLYVSEGRNDKAIETLQTLVNSSSVPSLKQVARLRMARLQAAKKSYDNAMTTLSQVDDKAYMPLINELKGDVYAATGKYQQALGSYREAINAARTQRLGNLYLEMKTNELAGLSQSAKVHSTAQNATSS